MKAVGYEGPYKVVFEHVAEPKIEQPLDAIIRTTSANIWGSDLHPYEGRSDLESGMAFGHENKRMVGPKLFCIRNA